MHNKWLIHNAVKYKKYDIYIFHVSIRHEKIVHNQYYFGDSCYL